MINGKKVVIIIPIREGSQRIKNKNMVIFKNKLLTKWYLDKIKDMKYLDKIIINTESLIYKKACESWGFEVMLRRDELACDKTTLPEVIQNAAMRLKMNYGYSDTDYIIRSEVTKPLTKIEQFHEVIEYANDNNMDSVFIQKKIKIFLENDKAINSQDLPDRFQKWGSVRLRTIKTAIEMDVKTWGEGIKHHNLNIVEAHEIDINDKHDLICARALVQAGY